MSFVSVPCKKTTSVDLTKPLKNFIRNHYDESVASESVAAVDELQKLRDAVCIKLQERRSTVEQIALYHDAMFHLENRVNMSENGACIGFKWYDISGRVSGKVYSSHFERANLIFCFAASHSQLAENCKMNSESSLQQAVKSFKVAANAFDYLASNVYMAGPDPLMDLTPEALSAFCNVMIAQAHECVFMKAEKDNTKAALVAKLAAKASSLYDSAIGDCGLSSLKYIIPKEWTSVFTMKKNLYAAISEYYQAKACGDEKKYGEQVARIRHAYDLIKAVSRSSLFTRKHLVEQIKQDRDAMVKDNDFIYHESIPTQATLSAIPMVEVVKKTTLTMPLLSPDVKDLFESLVPLPVSEALNSSKAVRASLISAEAGRLREATNTLNEVMVSLNLPAAIQKVGVQTIPDALLTKASKIREQGGAEKLYELISSLPESAQRNREILAVEESTLEEEEKSDDNLRAQYGEKWIRKPSKDLTVCWRQDIQKFKAFLETTQQTDASLMTRYKQYEKEFEILSKSSVDLKAYVTSHGELNESTQHNGNETTREELCRVCDQIEVLKAERADLLDQLELVDLPPDFTKKLLKIYQEQGQITDYQMTLDVLNDRLQVVRECIRENLTKQDDLLAQLQSKAEAYFGTNNVSGKSEGLLTSLTAASEEYFLLLKDVQDGMKFYADVTERCLKTQAKIKDFCFARCTEKTELMADISSRLASVQVSEPESVPKLPTPSRPPPTYAAASSVDTTTASAPPAVATMAGMLPSPYPPMVSGWNPAPFQFGNMMPPLPNYAMHTYPPGGAYSIPMYGYYPPMVSQTGQQQDIYNPGRPPAPQQ